MDAPQYSDVCVHNPRFLSELSTEIPPNEFNRLVPPFCPQEADDILQFVAEGGGVIVGGQAWYWRQENAEAPWREYDGNK